MVVYFGENWLIELNSFLVLLLVIFVEFFFGGGGGGLVYFVLDSRSIKKIYSY